MNENSKSTLESQLSLEDINKGLEKFRDKKYLLSRITFEDIKNRFDKFYAPNAVNGADKGANLRPNEHDQNSSISITINYDVKNKEFNIPNWLANAGIVRDDLHNLKDDKALVKNITDKLKDVANFNIDFNPSTLEGLIQIIDEATITIPKKKPEFFNGEELIELKIKDEARITDQKSMELNRKIQKVRDTFIDEINKAKKKINSGGIEDISEWDIEQLENDNDFIGQINRKYGDAPYWVREQQQEGNEEVYQAITFADIKRKQQ